MDEQQEKEVGESVTKGMEAIDLEALSLEQLVALVEERVIENLTRAIEHIVQERE